MCGGSCGGSTTNVTPDPNIGIAQERLAGLQERQNQFYEANVAPRLLDQLDQSITISKDQADRSAEMQDFQTGLMRKYDDRYWGTQVPLEDQLIDQAKTYNTAQERERMAGEAGADVEQAAAGARATLGRGLRGMGINMGSAGALSAMTDMATSTALARASAMNKTREAARQLGWTKLGEAAALGRGLPGFGSTSAGLSMGAGAGAINAGNSGLGAVGTASGISNAGYGAGAGIAGQMGQLGLGTYNAQINAAQVAGQNDPFNTVLGAATGIGMNWGLKKLDQPRTPGP